MDEFEITEANKNVLDLIQELQDKNDTVVDEDNPYDVALPDDGDVIGDSSDEEEKDNDSDGIIQADDGSDSGIIQDDD
eukprot:UN02344